MNRIIPLKKRSKKAQRAWHLRQRAAWDGVNPVTRIVPDKKTYDRKRDRQALRRSVDHESI